MTFAYEQTPSNTYRFGWVDAAVNRDTNNLVSAAIELFRNGDVVVTTNGVAALLPRTLPFPHDGYGQDEEWVAANFTNTTEIAAAGGYAAWVDAQVGTDLTNGLYKFTAMVPDDPPETVQLVVGDLSVAVTNAGNYVFLLEKGIDYGYGIIPFMTNVSYSAVDDVPQMRGGAGGLRSLPGDAVRAWTVDGGYGNEPQTDSSLGVVWWLPLFFGSPDVSQHLGPGDGPLEFTANLADCRAVSVASYSWSASEGLTVHSPNAQTTQITVDSMPSWAQSGVSVTATLGNHELYSHLDGFTYGTNSTPQAGISLTIPRVMFQNNDDDNGDGTNDYEHVEFGILEDDVVKGSVAFSSDVFTNGTIRIDVSQAVDHVYTNESASAEVYGTFDVAVEGETSRTIDLYFNPMTWSHYQNASVTAVWIPEGGDPQTSSVPFTVVQPIAEPICSETVEHSVLGTNHVYTVNPCGVAVGDDAYFSVEVLPGAFPDSEIVWTNRDGHVEFVGGNTGRSVHVRGVSLGDAELEVIIGGRTRQAPTFPLKVVTPQTFKITAWIVEDAQYNQRPIEPAEVQNMIAPLNDIYRQVGVSFYLDSVTVTNIPAACNLLYDSTTNDVWNYDRLVTVVGHDTGGIECYFVNDIVRLDGKPGPLASNCDFGLVLTPDAPVVTLAHEIGHAFGLKDVYASNREKDSSIPPADVLKVYDELDAGHDEKIHFASCIDDWNGGCQGCGNGGERYYLPDTTLRDVLHRLVMYGVDQKDGNQRDITIGSVRGVWYTKHDGIRYWHLSDAPVGFFSNLYKKASPAHQ